MDFSFFGNGIAFVHELMMPILFILGPTAAGKSEVAHRIALESGARILCMDSMQVYRGLEIGVGKPTAVERGEVVYGGLDLAEIDQEFDVVAYLKAAEEFLSQAQKDQKPVVIVGGTGLYYRALTRGFSEVPEIDPAIREALEGVTLEDLQKELHVLDPEIMVKIDLKNPRRLIRALEVKKGTGKSLLEWQQQNQEPVVKEFSAFFLDWENLRARIDSRTPYMVGQGWREEVQGLLEKWGEERVQKLPAIGYDILLKVIRGEISQEVANEEIRLQTWHYARRQLTWFRKESKYKRLNLSADSSLSLVIDSICRSGWLNSCS